MERRKKIASSFKERRKENSQSERERERGSEIVSVCTDPHHNRFCVRWPKVEARAQQGLAELQSEINEPGCTEQRMLT